MLHLSCKSSLEVWNFFSLNVWKGSSIMGTHRANLYLVTLFSFPVGILYMPGSAYWDHSLFIVSRVYVIHGKVFLLYSKVAQVLSGEVTELSLAQKYVLRMSRMFFNTFICVSNRRQCMGLSVELCSPCYSLSLDVCLQTYHYPIR